MAVRQNFHEDCEAGINKQINMEFYASYVYLSMSYFFDRDDIALPGFREYFKQMSKEEIEHAEKLMKYQNMRGGRIVLKSIAKPEVEDWKNGLKAMMAALELEKTVNQALLDLHTVATAHNDANMCNFLESEFLQEQVEHIKELSNYVSNLHRVGDGLGEYLFDRETMHSKDDRIS
ncbi:soma ferritin-like [Stegodyphus dumicola]|uniref:soma ferritin-like n=1 Tax=Stegodyphus dumicola TaxID=202533 RepID=UPI0015B308E9|nr:soma ferritin-like [Stegodyphus dumicola]